MCVPALTHLWFYSFCLKCRLYVFKNCWSYFGFYVENVVAHGRLFFPCRFFYGQFVLVICSRSDPVKFKPESAILAMQITSSVSDPNCAFFAHFRTIRKLFCTISSYDQALLHSLLLHKLLFWTVTGILKTPPVSIRMLLYSKNMKT